MAPKVLPPHPVKFIKATTEAEAREKERELEIESSDIRENTNNWAHAQAPKFAPPLRETIEIGEIETEKMNLKDKSNLLHSVAMSAEKDLKE